MTNQEILQKAIEKGEKNGFKYSHWSDELVFWLDKAHSKFDGYKAMIFSHDFAKAFWGENKLCYICKKSNTEGHSMFCSKRTYSDADLIAWEYHLSKMVLQEEPLRYLEKFLTYNLGT